MRMNNQANIFIGCDSSYKECQIALFGAPFDGTSSFRSGSRFGSSAIRSDSVAIETYSPYLDKSLDEKRIFDGGDLELPFGNSKKALAIIESYTEKLLCDEKKPVMLGGEHLVSLGAVRAIIKKYPRLRVVHFDAHTDLREEYLGEKLSHATVMKRIWELVGDGKIFQFGIRSGEKAEFEWAKSHTILNKFNFNGLEDAVTTIGSNPVYFSIDLDILDTSCFCGTGTPEAGGVSFVELMAAITKVTKLNIVGCDLNELAPQYDQSGASTAVACKTLRELLLQL